MRQYAGHPPEAAVGERPASSLGLTRPSGSLARERQHGVGAGLDLAVHGAREVTRETGLGIRDRIDEPAHDILRSGRIM